MSRRRTYPVEHDAIICDMRAGGSSFSEIARALNRPWGGIQWRWAALTKAGLNPHKPSAWPADGDDRMRAMFAAGVSDKKMAADLVVEMDVMMMRRRVLGLHRLPDFRGAEMRMAPAMDAEAFDGPAVLSLPDAREWAARNAPKARTIAEVNVVRLALGVPPIAVRRSA